MRNKFVLIIFTVLVLYMIVPFYSFASSNTKFVWSEIANPTVETVSSINKDKRKLFKFNLR